MNTSPCCEKCKRFDDFNKNIEAGTAETYCANPSCPCHQPQDWREALAEYKFDDFMRSADPLKKIISFIESEKLKSYEEGKRWNKTYNEGRIDIIDELLAAWPKEEPQDNGHYGLNDKMHILYNTGYNKGLHAGRAIIESKKLDRLG